MTIKKLSFLFIVAAPVVFAGCTLTNTSTNTNTSNTNTTNTNVTNNNDNTNSFDVSEELDDVYEEGDEPSAVSGDEETKETGTPVNDDVVNDVEVNNTVEPAPGLSAPGVYEEYDESKLERAANGTVILFFHADWCTTCRALEKDIEANIDDIPEGTSILKLDYDTEFDLRKKYGVTLQHTLVQVDENGEMISKWTGGNSLNSILSRAQ